MSTYYPPPPGGNGASQQQYAPPPTSPPPNQTSFQYAAPPTFSPPNQTSFQYAAPPTSPLQVNPRMLTIHHPLPPPQQAIPLPKPSTYPSPTTTATLAMGCPLTVKPGAMIAMTPTITLKGAIKILDEKTRHRRRNDPFDFHGSGRRTVERGTRRLSSFYPGVIKEYKRQGIGKAMFSGEGLFVYKISGVGLLWISSLGAIIRKDLKEGERYIVDNGHLVAWNTKYILERVASGGIISGLSSGEGLVCKFTGPGPFSFKRGIRLRLDSGFSAHAGGV
ncbi:hypothetical protein DID88_006814 [Monilinia fructigena]|uniref:Altered inheritance of mitochondria protein 24, mitochondrial n=1 Tax=Monilinia fructigena TaxID=38457 RepID=A0A395IGU4_9HELO|nr:hypothetical protein DID88_006814 [Monilinia fructigena]